MSEQYLAEFDQIAAFHRSEAAKRAGVPTTGVSAAVQPPVVAPRRKRRTKAEMAEFRAATQSRIDAAAREVTPDWLNEPDEMLEQILGQPHDD